MSYGPDRDWLIRFCPPEQSAALAALFTVEREVSASLRAELEDEVAHARLEWWHEELTRLAAGTAQHPATRALSDAAARQERSPPDLRSLVNHVRVDLVGVAFLTREELDQHLHGWGTSIFREAALGARAPATLAERLASRAGALVRELELLSEFARHARAGRIYRPLGDPAESHVRWQAVRLGAAESAEIESRQRLLLAQVCDAAAATDAAARALMRVPLLWMSYAVERVTRPPASALRRTLASWRSAWRLSRGKLPRSLQRQFL